MSLAPSAVSLMFGEYITACTVSRETILFRGGLTLLFLFVFRLASRRLRFWSSTRPTDFSIWGFGRR